MIFQLSDPAFQTFCGFCIIYLAIFVAMIVIVLKEGRAKCRVVAVTQSVVVSKTIKEVSNTEVASFNSDSDTVFSDSGDEHVTDVKARRRSFSKAVKGVKTVCRKITKANGTKATTTTIDLSTFRFPSKNATDQKRPRLASKFTACKRKFTTISRSEERRVGKECRN